MPRLETVTYVAAAAWQQVEDQNGVHKKCCLPQALASRQELGERIFINRCHVAYRLPQRNGVNEQ